MKTSSNTYPLRLDQQYFIHFTLVIAIIAAIYYDGYGWETFIHLSFIVGFYKIIKFLLTIFQPFLTRRHNLRARYGGGVALITGGS
jgi:hypothetical protein